MKPNVANPLTPGVVPKDLPETVRTHIRQAASSLAAPNIHNPVLLAKAPVVLHFAAPIHPQLSPVKRQSLPA